MIIKNNEQVIIKPILTEKTTNIRDYNKYTFIVHSIANKIQVMKACEELFKVKPIACNILNYKPRKKSMRGQAQSGFTASYKKAIVTLAPGEKITMFEGV